MAPSSNLSPETGYPDGFFCGFHQSVLANRPRLLFFRLVSYALFGMFVFLEAVMTRALESVFTWKRGMLVLQLPFLVPERTLFLSFFMWLAVPPAQCGHSGPKFLHLRYYTFYVTDIKYAVTRRNSSFLVF
jgi:hypothetical protein